MTLTSAQRILAEVKVEADDYSFGVCVCGKAILRHKNRKGYWHVNGKVSYDHSATATQEIP